MKKIFFSLTLLVSSIIYTETEHKVPKNNQHITLESEVLHLFDGTSIGVNADTLELIGLIRREINIVLIGRKTKDGKYVGLYKFENNLYSLEELAETEKRISTLTPQQRTKLDDAFKAAREDIKKNFRPFIESARNTKHHMVKLVEESCHKRNNMKSFLLNWAEQKVGEEEKGFDCYINNAEKLKSFCVDLLNFLGDLVRSCPKAQKLFRERVKKCKKISTMMPSIFKNIKNNKSTIQKAFMHYLKEHRVDKLQLSEITHNKLQNLLKEFIHKHY